MNLFYLIIFLSTVEGFRIHALPWEDYLLIPIISTLLAVTAGIMSGCTVGLMGIDKLALKMKAASGSEEEKIHAKRILPLLADHHLLLVTLLLCNALALETLPIVVEMIVGEAYAVVISVLLTLFLGEIIPQALCTGKGQIPIVSALSRLIRVFMFILWPVSYPIARVLDKVIGHNIRKKLNNEELKVIFAMQLDSRNRDRLDESQVCIIHNAIDFENFSVADLVINLADVFCLNSQTVVNDELMTLIIEKNYSRVPVIDESLGFIGVLLVKHLLLVDNGVRIKDLHLREPLYFSSDMSLMEGVNFFSKGRSHLAFVKDISSGKIIGILTLEDILKKFTQKKAVKRYRSFSDINFKNDDNLNFNIRTRRSSIGVHLTDEISMSPNISYDLSKSFY